MSSYTSSYPFIITLKSILSKGGVLCPYHWQNFVQERQAKAAAQKADAEAQIEDMKEKVAEEQARKEQLIQDKKALEAEVI